LFVDHPCLQLLGAINWEQYIHLTSEIYDLLDANNGPTEVGIIQNKIRNYFNDDDPEPKVYQFLSNSFVKWRTLKDSVDNTGTQYVGTTPEGREFLTLLEEQILARPQFVGFGADRLLGSLNRILANQGDMTTEEAIRHHEREIEKYAADIERIKEKGVKGSEILSHHVSPMELFTEAEQASRAVLIAQEAVKNKIKSVRVNLFESYTAESESVGRRIELTAEFHKALRETEEFKSYDRARDALSHIEGLTGANYTHKEIPQILSSIAREQLVEESVITSSPLQRFQKEFELIKEQIDQEIARQINILKLQVYYATSGDGRLVHENLRKLSGIILQNAEQSEEFLESLKMEINQGLDFQFGTIARHSFEIPEKIVIGPATLASLSDDEYRKMVEEMKRSEEASIKQIIEKLKETLTSDGVVKLSEYRITMGGIEYYVLARPECFDQALHATRTAQCFDILVNNKREERFWIKSVSDLTIEFARST